MQTCLETKLDVMYQKRPHTSEQLVKLCSWHAAGVAPNNTLGVKHSEASKHQEKSCDCGCGGVLQFPVHLSTLHLSFSPTEFHVRISKPCRRFTVLEPWLSHLSPVTPSCALTPKAGWVDVPANSCAGAWNSMTGLPKGSAGFARFGLMNSLAGQS